MALKALFVLIITLSTTLSWGNLYQCSGKSVKPVPFQESSQSSISYETTLPFIHFNYKEQRFHSNKTPFLIYYAIDSSEAFMQYSVRFEIAKLIESCRRSPKVNFIGILNSLFVEKNQIIVCKNQKAFNLDLSKFTKLNSSLITKRKYISTGDHASSDDLGPLTYLVRYFPHSNKAFGKYPLAHPDFLYDLINFVMTEQSLFPIEEFIPYLNLKSHGSKNAVLAGMQSCQEKAKVLSADKIIRSLLTKKELNILRNNVSYEEILKNMSSYESALSKLELDSQTGLGNRGTADSSLDQTRLGGMRLGSAISGLGVNEGLGVEFAFGTYHINLNWVLDDLFENGTNRALGFLMLESCDTNRNADFFHSYLDNILGFYSARHSLWYRNLNWWTMLEKADGSSLNLSDILKEETSKIRNIKVN